MIFAVDPDPQGGATVLLTNQGELVSHSRDVPVSAICSIIMEKKPGRVVVEGLQSYGMPVGRSVFETAMVVGSIRFACQLAGVGFDEITRTQAKAAVCNAARAKDPQVRAALIDLYGGDRERAIGTKKAPGPLYGIAKDEWAALAVGLTWLRQRRLGPLARRDGITPSGPQEVSHAASS